MIVILVQCIPYSDWNAYVLEYLRGGVLYL